MPVYDLIIIGAGAAGLFAGALSAQSDKLRKVLILEKNSKPGVKILLSGNGQCNFTHNAAPADFVKHYGDKSNAVKHVIYNLTSDNLIKYFQDNGIDPFIREDDKVFPASMKAEDIRNLLLNKIETAGIELKYSQNIIELCKHEDIFTIKTSRTSYQSKRLLIASGGLSYLMTGTNWNAFELIEGLGHKIVPLKPALCPPKIKDFIYASLMGISFKDISMTLKKADNKKKHFQGDMLFTHFGVSGPLVLDASRYFDKGDKLIFNFTPFAKFQDFTHDFVKLMKRNPKKIIRNILSFYPIPAALILIVMQKLNIPITADVYNISNKKLDKLLEALFYFELEILEPGSYNIAMATSGGVDLKEINMKTMESKLITNLYFAGEVLDVDGDTGGYNIHFAFASAYTAINSIK